MSQMQNKRARSDSDVQSGVEVTSDTSQAKREVYGDPRYPAVMETMGVYVKDSAQGPIPEDLSRCIKILTDMELPVPKNDIFESEYLSNFQASMKNSSEMGISVRLHRFLVPSPSIMNLDNEDFTDLKDGYKDLWLQAVPYYQKLPQPYFTVAFDAQALDEGERTILDIVPGASSIFAACEGMVFPFLTCEVRADKDGLGLARRANAESMAVALEGLVALFRRAGRQKEIHRKILAISICHNGTCIEFNGHYPEIDGALTRYYQHSIETINYASNNGQDRYKSYRFVQNIYAKFAPLHLQRIKDAICHLGSSPQAPTFEFLAEYTGGDAIGMAPRIPTGSSRDSSSLAERLDKLKGRVTSAAIAAIAQEIAYLRTELTRQRQDYEQRLQEARQREDQLLKILKGLSVDGNIAAAPAPDT